MKIQNRKTEYGLRELKLDPRDFKYEHIFGSVSLEDIPDNFIVANPIGIKDQSDSDMCVAFATCAVSEDQENVPLEPKWFFSQIKKLQGNWKKWGADLRDGAKTAVNVGFIEENDAPFDIKYKDRDFTANWNNWPEDLNEKALAHRKQSFFSVACNFDSFRSVLWQNRDEKKTVLTGTLWESDWNNLKDGIIPEKSTGSEETPHAIKIFGQKKIGDKLYLVAQLSNGANFGDNGLFYFPEEIINSKFSYGAFIFKDLDPANMKKVSWSWKVWVYDFLSKLLKKIKI